MKKKYVLHVAAILLLLQAKVNAQCIDQTVNPTSSTIICNGSGTMSLASSELGVNYYVRNDANNLVVTGPVAGTGSSLALGTGSVGASAIFNIFAKKNTGGLAFDGIDDYVAVPNALNSNVDFTWETWIKTGDDGTIFSKTAASGVWASGGKSLFVRNGKITLEVFGAGFTETYNVYHDNNWHHVAVSAEMGYLGGLNDRVRIYVDGVFVVEKNNWDINSNSETGFINKIGYTNSNFPAITAFKGTLDNMKIWSSVRTATDVLSDMTSCLTGTETGLSAYYTFENASGTVLSDIAGGDNNGTLTNMAATAWTYGRDDCGSCTLQLSQKPIFVITNIADQSLSAASLTLCSNVSTTISTASSEAGVNYYLRNNATYSVVSGPYAGTGSALNLSTGTVANTTTYNVIAARLSGALSFDGVDDYVTINESALLENLGQNPFTIESWVFPNTVTGVKSIIRKDGDYNLYLNNGMVVAEVFPAGGNGGAFYQATGNLTLTPNKWSHVAIVWNGSTFLMYVNTISNTVSVSNASSASVSKLCIGGSRNFGQVFDGKIDEVRFWNGMRTVSQLTANIGSCLAGNEASLTAYYQFENGRGSSVLTDRTSGNNNGALANMDNINAWRTGVENCGCTLMLSQLPVITVNSSPTVTVNSGTICSGNSFAITASGASNYTITGGNFTVSPSATTSYSVTGSNSSGCVSAAAISTVTVNASPTISVNNYTVCSGNSAVITPTGAASYTITGGSFTVSPASTTAYSITGTSAAGCASGNTGVSNVAVNTTPTVSVNSGAICSGKSFTITPSGANTYTVTGGNFTVTPASNASYSITGTAANGCLAGNTAVATVTVNTTPTLSVNSATVCSGTSVVITPTGAATYTITGNTFTVTPSATTSYSITGTSSAGCAASSPAVSTVSISTTPTVSVNSGSICSGGSFTIVPSGATTYTITGGNYTVTPSSTTSYSVTGSNGSCVAANTAVSTITVNTTPTITVNSATICSGNSVAIVPSGASTYTITGGSFTVSPLTTTSYSVTGSGTNACVPGVAVSTIMVNATPVVSINSGAVCSGNSFILTPSGASNYTVSGNSFTVTPASTTSYSVTGTSTAGCVSAAAVSTVTVNALPFITVNGGAVCPGNSFTLLPTGASSYTYSGGSNIVTPGVNTSYTITGSSAQGCNATNTAVATVSVVNTLTINVNGNTSICSGQSTTLTANGASTYTWNATVQSNTLSVSPAVNTTYTVVGASGSCSNTALVTVSVSPVPTISVNSGSVCAGGTFTIVASGASSYTYSGGSSTVSPTSTTSYSVTGSNGPGCVSTNTAISQVLVYVSPTVTAASSRSVICVGESAILAAAGANSYVWSDAQTGGSITVAPPVNTTYTVTGTAVSGCVATATVLQRTDACTAINTLNSSALVFNIYPNPNTGRFTVETDEQVTISIINTMGQVVYSETTHATHTSISIAELANGIYYVKATANGSQHLVRIVKE